MKKIILSALLSFCCLVQAQTSHDDPIGGENGSVRLFFLKRTMLDRGKVGGIPANQIWQHTHKGATYMMVDPGDGRVRAIRLEETSVVDISLGAKSGIGYGGPAGSLRIRPVTKAGSGMFVQRHLDTFEAIRRERCPAASPSAQLMAGLRRSLSLEGPWTNERKDAHGRSFEDWWKTVCPQARSELSRHMADMDLVWETTLSPGNFGNPTPLGANQLLYTLSGTPGVRMVTLTAVTGGRRQVVEMKGADCARFVLCSHEETQYGQKPCALPTHSTRGSACAAWRDRTGYDTGIKLPN